MQDAFAARSGGFTATPLAFPVVAVRSRGYYHIEMG